MASNKRYREPTTIGHDQLKPCIAGELVFSPLSDTTCSMVSPWRRNDGFRGSVPPRRVSNGQQAGGQVSLVLVELLRPLVQGNSLSATVDDAESGDPQLLPGLHNRRGPSTAVLEEVLASCELLLGNHLAVLVKHEILLGQAALGVGRASIPNLAVGSSEHLPSHALRLLHLRASNGSLRCFGCARFGGLGSLRGLRFRGSSGLSGGFARGASGGAFGGSGLGGTASCFGGHGYFRIRGL